MSFSETFFERTGQISLVIVSRNNIQCNVVQSNGVTISALLTVTPSTTRWLRGVVGRCDEHAKDTVDSTIHRHDRTG